MVKKYMHENLKYTVTKQLAKKKNSIHSFRPLLPTIGNMFQISHQTILTLSWSFSQTILHTFLDIKQYWHFQRVTGEQYYRIYIKQCCYFQRVPSKWNYSKVQSTYHTILTLSDSYYQTILTYSELISSSIHTSTELLLNNSKHFLEFLNGHLNRQKILN